MNHESYEILISAQLDGALSPEEEAQLEKHLASCPACRRVRAELEGVHALLLGAAAPTPPQFSDRILSGLAAQEQRKRPPLLRRAAPFLASAAVLALVLLGLVRPALPFGPANDPVSSSASDTALESETVPCLSSAWQRWA